MTQPRSDLARITLTVLFIGGLIGGLVTFGIVGIFVGPVLLAVAYTLLDDWVTPAAPAQQTAPRPAPGH